ncbi:MAG: hypothetical protein RL016_498, partial [Actinomycetota bacterium]
RGWDDLDLVTSFGEQTNDARSLVGRDAAGDSEDYL